MSVLDRAFDHPLRIEERGAMPLAGGIAQQGYQCGMLWGSALAAGAQACRLLGPGPQAEAAAMRAAQRLVESFRARENSINCLEITDTDWTKKSQMLMNLLKGGPVTCMRMSARYAPVAFDAIHSALSERPVETPCSPVSCAAILARKMGLSDMHAVMAAGFAGGIGLSGGACGALGAAIWGIGMECAEAGLGYNAVNSRAGDAIERFLRSSDYEFECSAIVGRKFESVEDHACHVRNGGCSKIIEALASTGASRRPQREASRQSSRLVSISPARTTSGTRSRRRPTWPSKPSTAVRGATREGMSPSTRSPSRHAGTARSAMKRYDLAAGVGTCAGGSLQVARSETSKRDS